METLRFGLVGLVLSALALSSSGCAEDDPEAKTPSGAGGSGNEQACNPDEGLSVQDNTACSPEDDDYTPRDDASASDTWPACISDDNAYHPFEPNISSVARVGAFEQIATLLAFDGSRVPSAQDFLDARVVYAQAEGLESRVVRREDEHYPAAPAACRDLTDAEQLQYADRCVGPARIRPVLNEAFQQGASGIDLVRNAARIEAGVLWFFYVSSHKESTTCAEVPKDCDSGFAYYTGGETREGGLGLSRYVRQRSPQAHDRIWDGILAVRCWRDLDNPTGVSENAAMREQALGQLDHALLRGVAIIVRQRLERLDCGFAWESVKILGPVLDREAEQRDPAAAATLRGEFAKEDPNSVDVAAATTALDALFPCP
jgi:hypothetical protein